MASYIPPTEDLAIFDPSVFKKSTDPLTIVEADKRYLRFPNAQGTENFVDMNVYGDATIDGQITATGDLFLNPVGSIDCNGKTINMTGGEIHNVPLIHSQNNQDIVIEGKGTGDVILKTNNADTLTIADDGSVIVLNPSLHTPVPTSSTLSGVLSNGNNAGINNINMNNNSILNLNNVSSLNNNDITIEGKGTGDVVLKTNNLNRVIISDTGTIDVSSNTIQSVSNINSRTNQNMILDAKGASNSLILRGDASNAITVNGAGNIGVDFPIFMTANLPTRREIQTSAVNFSNAGVNPYNSTTRSQMYNSGPSFYIINSNTSGNTRFIVKDASNADINALDITSSALTVANNVNLAMGPGNGVISQTNITGTITPVNYLKKTDIRYNSNSATGVGTSALDVYDDFNNRGFFFLPNSGSGSLGNTNQQNDACITSRVQNGGVLTLSNWNSNLRNGIRIGTTDASNCFVSLQCGQNSTADWTEFRMDYTRTGGANTTTTSFNNTINFNPGGNLAPARRQLTGLGTLNFTDILGNTTAGTRNSLLYMDSSLVVPGMIYDCSLNNGNHIFTVNTNAGAKTSPFYVGPTLTSCLNTLSVRNANTTSNRLDISTGNSSFTTTMTARNGTASSNSILEINAVAVDANLAETPVKNISFTTTAINNYLPITLNTGSLAPADVGSLGGSITTDVGIVSNITTSSSVRSAANYTIPSAGVYLINACFNFGTVLNDAQFSRMACGVSSTNNAFNTTGAYSVSNWNWDSLFTIQHPATDRRPVSCVLRFTGSGTIYFNYVSEFNSPANTSIALTYTITRIG